MSYSLEWDEARRLHVAYYDKSLAVVPPEQAGEVWSCGTELLRQQRWSEFALFCAGIVYGAGAVGAPAVVDDVADRPAIRGGAARLPKAAAETDAARPAEIIRFPGGKSDG